MPDKDGNALPGEPAHWRYKKDQRIKARDAKGVTSTDNSLKKKESKEKTSDDEGLRLEDERQKLSKIEIRDLNKKEQVVLLESYGLSKKEIKAFRTEDQRIDKILKLQENKDGD